MGGINEVFSQNTLSFHKIEEKLTKLLEQNKNKGQNLQALQEIGFIKEFEYIKFNKSANELIYFSKSNKTIKSYINSMKLIVKFLEWAACLFGFDKEELDSSQKFNKKIELLKNTPLSKEFFQNNIKKNLFKNKLYNNLIIEGIPSNFREFIWNLILAKKYTNNRIFNYEEEKKVYNSYLKNVQNNPQIEKDLSRTFIDESLKSTRNLQILRNVLYSITKYNNEYCQGMNFVVGFLLKLTNFDEIKTFYIIKNIFGEIKGYYEDNFPLLNKNISIFDNYFKELNPKLYAYFKKNELFNEMWVGKWLQALFTISLPFEELCNVWDILIIKGFDFIIYICLAIIGSIEEELLKLNDNSDILSFIENALNPTNTQFIYKMQLEQEEKFIIPLNKIILNAFIIRKKIQKNTNQNLTRRMSSDSNLSRFSDIKKKDSNNSDFDSVFSKESNNSDHQIIRNNSFSARSWHCPTHSSKNLTISNISPNSSNNQNHINILKKNSMDNIQTKQFQNKKSMFFSSTNINHFNGLLNNNNIDNKKSEGRSLKSIGANSNFNNLNNLNNINNNFNNFNTTNHPIHFGQNVNSNTMNYNVINNRIQPNNNLIYYS